VYPEWLSKEHETGYILSLEVRQQQTKGEKAGGKERRYRWICTDK
jgi:hypothetical protein